MDSKITWREQLVALKDPKVWKLCQYYSIVFGGYVAMSLWMVQYYVGEFGLDIRAAALLAACFSLPGGVLRAVGGWVSDKYGAHSVTWWVLWVSWICLFLLSYPQTDMTILTVDGPKTFHIGLNVWLFTVLMFVLGIAWAFGKASVFKYISDDYPTNIGVISGVVGLAGGMGGFVLPIMFGALMDLTGIRSSAFMLMYGVVWVSLIWMYWTEVRGAELMGSKAKPFRLRGQPARSTKERHERTNTSRNRRVPRLPGGRADIADWRPEDNEFWESTGKKIAYRNLWISVPALLCGFAVWGMWGIITVQMLNLGFPFTPGGAVHADGDRRHLRRDDAHSGVVPDPPGRRAQHDLPDHRDAARAGHRHRHRAAAQGLAAVGVPADGAVVGRGRRQLRELDVQHQHVLPQAAAGNGARV